jgi:hypothetical protein
VSGFRDENRMLDILRKKAVSYRLVCRRGAKYNELSVRRKNGSLNRQISISTK